MASKIMYGGALLFVGWLWFYLFLRQFFFNLLTAYPLIRRMNALRPGLIAPGANRYTTVSVLVCLFISALIVGLIVWLCPLYLKLCFAGGALLGLATILPGLTPNNRPMFDTFCGAYYRFVPDDELRTAIYNKKTGQIKIRLRDMGIEGSFIPEFKKEKK